MFEAENHVLLARVATQQTAMSDLERVVDTMKVKCSTVLVVNEE